MQFVVRYFDGATLAVRQETFESDSEASLTARLEQSGHAVMSMRRLSRAFRQPASARFDVAWWCRELKTLLHAGMTVVEALETLQDRTSNGPRAAVQAAVLAQLRQGRALSAALADSGAFPSILIAGVRASERSGTLVEALDEYLRYHVLLDDLRKKVVSAALYPALVVVLGTAISVFLLLFVMPRFAGLYGNVATSTSAATQLLLALSHFLAMHGGLACGAALLLVAAVIGAWHRGLMTTWLNAVVERITPLRRQIDELHLARLYQSLTLLFRGGYSLNEALSQSVALGLGPRMSAAVAAAQTSLTRGERVSMAFARAGLTDLVSQRLLAVGERTGNFDRVLQTIAERHAETFTIFIERTTRLVEPVLMLLVALVVGAIVVMMYMPVFDIATSLRGSA